MISIRGSDHKVHYLRAKPGVEHGDTGTNTQNRIVNSVVVVHISFKSSVHPSCTASRSQYQPRGSRCCSLPWVLIL